MNRQFDNIDQNNRANNIKIDGVPEVKSENLIDVINKIALILKIPITPECIGHISRVRSTIKNKIKPIICNFNNVRLVSLFLKAARSKKLNVADIGFDNRTGNIYINEHLTVARKKLFYRAECFKTENDFKFFMD